MFTYIIRCMDDSLYCGYTTDIDRRIEEHKKSIGSKYVRAKKYKKTEIVFRLKSKCDAMKLEKRIKKLKKQEKEKLIAGDISLLSSFEIEFSIYFSE
ncbi:GIY-YIG nuclease family protein [Peptostreptococcus sp. D1]|uniref:GIY-YIG nuclease family protein n=1 Tax=Peptostreptococcus sp. D1 TaxID=72304 RepID=UPI0008EB9A7D|nr:GIY-YIG nuclease family protein [Peptostreptococcus sp. D1]SFE44096.1 putative endonuclease [Peptostreptococcus sp. D1]